MTHYLILAILMYVTYRIGKITLKDLFADFNKEYKEWKNDNVK